MPERVTDNALYHSEVEARMVTRKRYWESELESLGIKIKRMNINHELECEREELETLTDIIKQAYYQVYKSAYSSSTNDANDKDEEAKTLWI
jgi:hypothetical protein